MRLSALVLLALTLVTTVAPHSHHSVASFADDAELAGRCDASNRHFDSAEHRVPSECVACLRHQQQMTGTSYDGPVLAMDAASHPPYVAALRSRELRLASLRAPPAA